VKYEEVYLHAYENVREARQGVAGYMRYYNFERGHSSLEKLTPDQAYNQSLAKRTIPPVPRNSGTAAVRLGA
jgi:putative transposase